MPDRDRHHIRSPTFPLYYSTRKKPRRWPLVLRVIKGAIHVNVAIPVAIHALIAALICYLDEIQDGHLGIPSSVIPSLSIVVGLMLVFRNQTSYDRFWQGNQHLTTVETCIRNLTRSFLTCSYNSQSGPPNEAEKADTERTIRILLALIYAAKHHLRAEWGATTLPILISSGEVERRRRQSHSMAKPEYSELLPAGTRGHEEQGLGLLLQLSIQIEAYIKRGHDRGWFHAPQASQLTVQLNTLVSAYGSMETIHWTPLPVAYLIHMRQVLALFGCVLPFALVEEMGWWTILLTAFIMFTLYGIEAIGQQLEDPFGYDRNDIKVDAIVEDLRVETSVMLEEWRIGNGIFDMPGGAEF
jgi:ion channel-forming bestrophin family protein